MGFSPAAVVVRHFLFFLCLFLMTSSASTAQAYLDPTSGSVFLQVILGGIAGIGVLLSYSWKQILQFFRFKKPKPASAHDAVSPKEGPSDPRKTPEG